MNPADLQTKPLPKPKIEQPMNIMGYEFMTTGEDALRCRSGKTLCALDDLSNNDVKGEGVGGSSGQGL